MFTSIYILWYYKKVSDKEDIWQWHSSSIQNTWERKMRKFFSHFSFRFSWRTEGKDFHIDKNMFIPLLVKAAYSANKQTQTSLA
jgi:hypothetical protein